MRFPLLSFLILIIGFVTAYPQSAAETLERAKKISLLRVTRSEVRNIFWDFESDLSDQPGGSDSFTKDNISIDVEYSSGGCSDDDAIWDISEGAATEIKITTEEPLPIKSFGINLSSLEKERAYSDEPKSYVYYRKDKSLVVEVDDQKVRKITLLPSKDNKINLCDNDRAKGFAADKWFGDTELEDRHRLSNDGNKPASVDSVDLSTTELLSLASDKDVKVKVSASDPENDVLTYTYTVSGGRIIGSGSNVIWRLQGTPPGTYSITVGVDDGCGVCGKTMTKTVVIK